MTDERWGVWFTTTRLTDGRLVAMLRIPFVRSQGLLVYLFYCDMQFWFSSYRVTKPGAEVKQP